MQYTQQARPTLTESGRARLVSKAFGSVRALKADEEAEEADTAEAAANRPTLQPYRRPRIRSPEESLPDLPDSILTPDSAPRRACKRSQYTHRMNRFQPVEHIRLLLPRNTL